MSLAPLVDHVAESNELRDYVSLCAALTNLAEDNSAVVHESDMKAKLLNLACPIEGPQAIGFAGIELLPVKVGRAVLVSNCKPPLHMRPAQWARTRNGECIDNAMLTVWERSPGDP